MKERLFIVLSIILAVASYYAVLNSPKEHYRELPQKCHDGL